MYKDTNVLNLWSKISKEEQRRLRREFLKDYDKQRFRNDFIGFLSNEFNLFGKRPPARKVRRIK